MPSDFGFIEAQFGTRYSANAGVSLSQLLFDGQVFVGLLARKATMEFAAKNAEVTEELIMANVAKVYYQLIVSRSQVELLDSNIALLEKNARDTRILYENGFREKLDVDKTEVQLANLRTERIKVVNQVSNGYYGLKLLMGMPVRDELVLTDALAESFVDEARRTMAASGRQRVDVPRCAGVGLRHHAAARVEQGRGQVARLAHDGREGDALQGLGLFADDADQVGPEDFKFDTVEFLAHDAFSRVATTQPKRSTDAVHPGGMTMVVSRSSMMAGPGNDCPTESEARS
jgi:hypothetical protein